LRPTAPWDKERPDEGDDEMCNPFTRKQESSQAQETTPSPLSLDAVSSWPEPYLHDGKPMDFFFEYHIMEVIGVLPRETVEALDAFVREHAEAFETGDWRSEVCVGFELPETIDVAILDRWLHESAADVVVSHKRRQDAGACTREARTREARRAQPRSASARLKAKAPLCTYTSRQASM
jgi:hypothetical protein